MSNGDRYEWLLERRSTAGTIGYAKSDLSDWTSEINQAWKSSGTETQECINVAGSGLAMHPTYTYHFQVRAMNQAGLKSAAKASDGFTYDATPPAGGWVRDGLGNDARWAS